jgi:hypothetical protein
MKAGNLNFLESSGPLQACNGTALALPLRRNVTLTTVTVDKTTVIVINRACCKTIISSLPLGLNGIASPSTKILQNALTNYQPSIGWEPAQAQPILSEFNCKPQ